MKRGRGGLNQMRPIPAGMAVWWLGLQFIAGVCATSGAHAWDWGFTVQPRGISLCVNQCAVGAVFCLEVFLIYFLQ